MTLLDRALQQWRIRKAATYLKAGDRILDVGCADGILFRQIRGLGESVGLDPDLELDRTVELPNVRFIRGQFPQVMLANEWPRMIFDAITMLAVLEHITPDQHSALVSGCARLLRQGGQLIITVPSPAVDHILAVLKTLKLVDGMSLDQHHGFKPHQTADIFSAHGFQPIAHHRFQLGLNNLFVFRRDALEAPSPAGVGLNWASF
jgi:2-polyprenyl-3-methyl-5-hydroxy-6-metoxy-1,4-benzoquinol methylase